MSAAPGLRLWSSAKKRLLAPRSQGARWTEIRLASFELQQHCCSKMPPAHCLKKEHGPKKTPQKPNPYSSASLVQQSGSMLANSANCALKVHQVIKHRPNEQILLDFNATVCFGKKTVFTINSLDFLKHFPGTNSF